MGNSQRLEFVIVILMLNKCINGLDFWISNIIFMVKKMKSISKPTFAFAIICLLCALSPTDNKNVATRYSGRELYSENNFEQLQENRKDDKFLALQNLVAKIDENMLYDLSEEALSSEENLIRVRRSPIPKKKKNSKEKGGKSKEKKKKDKKKKNKKKKDKKCKKNKKKCKKSSSEEEEDEDEDEVMTTTQEPTEEPTEPSSSSSSSTTTPTTTKTSEETTSEPQIESTTTKGKKKKKKMSDDSNDDDTTTIKTTTEPEEQTKDTDYNYY